MGIFEGIVLIILGGTTLSGIISLFESRNFYNVVGVCIPWLWYFCVFYWYPFMLDLFEKTSKILAIICMLVGFFAFIWGSVGAFCGYVVIYYDDFFYKEEIQKLFNKLLKKSNK